MPVNHSEIPVLKIFIAEKDGIGRKDQPVRMGVPLPRGFLLPDDDLHLCGEDGNVVAVQKRTSALWPDGSVKWLLLDFCITIKENHQTFLTLEKGDNIPAAHLPGLVVVQNESVIEITNASFSCAIDRARDVFFSSIKQAGVELLGREGWSLHLRDEQGHLLPYDVLAWEVEEAGELRATVRCEGRFYPGRKKRRINFTVRHTFFAGKGLVQTDFTLHNPQAALHPGGLWDLGDPGSFFFTELSINCCGAISAETIEWQAEKEAPVRKSPEPNWILYQDSSGGERWDSINHIDCKGNLTTKFRGYRQAACPEKLITPDSEGERATPWARMLTRNGWLGGTIQHFWQNFPKSLGLQENRLIFGLFPPESEQTYELQGGEQKRHTLFLHFGQPQEEILFPALQHMLHIHIDPEWVEYSHAVPYFVAEKKDADARYLSYINNCIQGPHSFLAKREIIDEYGWRNFGDIYADHEAVNHTGEGPFISHYNNQYDFIYGGLIHFLRSGDNRWYELAAPAARHMIDIDIYHTDDDKPGYCHGLFWHTDHYSPAHTSSHRAYSRKNKTSPHYGGGTSNEHIYSSGLSLYYYLTGDELAKATVFELAEYVIAMDDGKKTIFSFIDEGPTGLASQTVATDFHKPGRGAGNCINCLLDAYRLSNKREYLEKAQELLRRCIHPNDDIHALHLDDPEYRWSYLVFLQVLGKFLSLKEETGEKDYCYFYARDSLLHYSSWMAAHEIPYKEALHKVLIPTETWPAHDIRKCHIFHLAAHYCRDSERMLFRGKADFFFQKCLEDLLGFETRFLTRPLILLAVYGYIHSYFEKNDQDKKFISHCHDFGDPVNFVPQRQRIKNVFNVKARETMRLLKLLLIGKFWSMRAK